MQTILLVNDNGGRHARHLEESYEITQDVSKLSEGLVDAVLFTGGSDVSAQLYGQSEHPATWSNRHRDAQEQKIYQEALKQKLPMFGICRGAQFLCVMAGGSLVQDLTGHRMNTHSITAKTTDGKLVEISVPGDHHQMAYAEEIEHEVLAWSTKPLSCRYDFNGQDRVSVDEASEWLCLEPDVIHYPQINAIGFQYHPEWAEAGSEAAAYFADWVAKLIVKRGKNYARQQ